MANDVQEIDYEELTSLNRLESNSGQLQNVRKDLYPQIAKLLERCRKKIADCDPDSPEFAEASHDSAKTKKVARDLVDRRIRKIINLGITSGSGGNNVVEALTPEEKEMYERILTASKKLYDDVFTKKKAVTMNIAKPEAKPELEMEKATIDTKIVENVVSEGSSTPVTEVPKAMSKPSKKPVPVVEDYDVEDPEECPVPKQQPVSEPVNLVPKEDEKGTILIRILQDTPQFSGLNDVVYTLKKEDIVRMPSIFATALISRGLAKPITL